MIGGNLIGEIQINMFKKNEIGEKEHIWITVQSIKGWLDYLSGDAQRVNYSAKIQESTHVFIADYIALNELVNVEGTRMLINGKVYDITLIDNPMELNRQLEIYLKYTGGQ